MENRDKIKVKGIPLFYWIKNNNIQEDTKFKDSYFQQISFMNNEISKFFHYNNDNNIFVIGDYMQESIKLPIYLCDANDIKFILKNNFKDWRISVISSIPIDIDFSGLFKVTPPIDPNYTGDPLHPSYFDGFPRELIFSYYEESDKTRWSAKINNNYILWTTIFIIMKYLGLIVPAQWSKRTFI